MMKKHPLALEDEEVLEVYVVKYWRTQGVFKKRVTKSSTSDDLLKVLDNPGHLSWYLHKGDYRLTREGAIEYVTQAKAKKVASLQKQLAKVEELDPEDLVPKD